MGRAGLRHGWSQVPALRLVCANGGYSGPLVAGDAAANDCRVEIVVKPADQKGFVVLPRRWVVERTFAWLGRNRRLAKDFEKSIESSTAWIFMASVQLISRRLANP